MISDVIVIFSYGRIPLSLAKKVLWLLTWSMVSVASKNVFLKLSNSTASEVNVTVC